MTRRARSDGEETRPPGGPAVYFIDECLGRHRVAEGLRRVLGVNEVIETVPQGTPDEEWLVRAGEGEWICFSKDRRMRHRPNELAAIKRAKIGLITLGEANAEAHSALTARSIPLIRRARCSLKRPFVARLEPSGELRVLCNDGEMLKSPRLIKPKPSER
jgi:hypothetical protein